MAVVAGFPDFGRFGGYAHKIHWDDHPQSGSGAVKLLSSKPDYHNTTKGGAREGLRYKVRKYVVQTQWRTGKQPEHEVKAAVREQRRIAKRRGRVSTQQHLREAALGPEGRRKRNKSIRRHLFVKGPKVSQRRVHQAPAEGPAAAAKRRRFRARLSGVKKRRTNEIIPSESEAFDYFENQ